MTMSERKIVRRAYCKCCKQIAPVYDDGTFAWHDYPPIFDGTSVEGSYIGLCGMIGYAAPPEEKKKEGKTVDPAV